MLIQIETASHTPIYLQIEQQVRMLVASGRMTVGERLPSVRGLAEALLVNPNTVARAYRALERDGVVVGRKGDGVFVAERPETGAPDDREAILTERVDALLDAAGRLGVAPHTVIRLVRQRARAGEDKKKEQHDD